MPIVYNKLLKLLKKKGITSYTLKKDNVIGQATFKKIKEGGDIDTRTIAKLCKLLDCQPGDILEYVKYDLKSVDANDCPISDNPVIRGECTGCKYYKGFEMYNELPCVRCSYNYVKD